MLEGDTEVTQFPGPFWKTVTARPPMVSTAARASPVFGDTEIDVVPLPVPDPPFVIVTKGALFVVVQPQSADVNTLNVPVPPDAEIEMEVGETVNVHDVPVELLSSSEVGDAGELPHPAINGTRTARNGQIRRVMLLRSKSVTLSSAGRQRIRAMATGRVAFYGNSTCGRRPDTGFR